MQRLQQLARALTQFSIFASLQRCLVDELAPNPQRCGARGDVFGNGLHADTTGGEQLDLR